MYHHYHWRRNCLNVTNSYHSSRWERKREHILKRDKYLCRLTKRYGTNVDASIVHHIYPADEYPEYFWCDWNLISVSSNIHNKLHDRKTRKLTQLGEDLKRRTKPQ